MLKDRSINRHSERYSVYIRYNNHKGEQVWRHIVPSTHGIFWGIAGHHKVPQWLLSGYDIDQDGWHSFAMKDIKEWCCDEPTP